jgi:hypothetical protein
MSAFRPLGGKQMSALDVRDAYTERKIARMVANGTPSDIARYILENARHARKAKAERRRLTGLRIREHAE